MLQTMHWYERILLLSGIVMLASVAVIYFFEDFTTWTIAKAFYGFGVLLFAWYA